jgi:uncharacterized protein YutE (UPF0331/DUF86 family)
VVDRNVVQAKLAQLEGHIDRVRLRCPPEVSDLARNRDACDLVAFNLMLAVQICLDVASHVIADEGWPSATTLASAFRSLAEHAVLDQQTADALATAAGLRNVVAHGYGGINVALLHRAATSGLADLRAFSHEVAAWLAKRP